MMGRMLVLVLTGIFCLAPLVAQKQGPLVIRQRPPRPKKTPPPPPQPAPVKIPEEKEAWPEFSESGPGGCPAGYVPRPTLTRRETGERPRLTRKAEDAEPTIAEPEEEDVETVECVWVGKDERTADVAVPQEDFLTNARRTVFEFSSTLPNFVCEQHTSRYVSYSNPPKWELQDRLSAEVVYENSKETYRNFKRNGRPLKSRDPYDSGAWSSGEFASLMQGVFHPLTNAKFTDQGETRISGKRARLYDFEVPASRSKWRVAFEEIAVHPAYKGSVWFDPESHRVLRLEIAAENLPDNFGLDAVEMSVEYDKVRIGAQEHLLTSHAINLGCQRGSRICSKNEIDFRGFRRFSAESTIVLTDSSVEYEEQPKK